MLSRKTASTPSMTTRSPEFDAARQCRLDPMRPRHDGIELIEQSNLFSRGCSSTRAPQRGRQLRQERVRSDGARPVGWSICVPERTLFVTFGNGA
jgi:hypothetical protein